MEIQIDRQQEERNKIQGEAVELSKQHKHLLLEWATGTGKGLACFKCMAASSSLKKWLIVVPEILQIANYKADLIKHGYEWMLGIKIEEIICYNSLSKYRNRELNLHLNEAHRLSDAKLDISFSMKFDQIISDSATVPKEVKERLNSLCPYHIIELPMKEAIERGILSVPKFHIIGVELNNKLRRNEKIVKKKVYKYTDLSMSLSYDKQMQIWDKRIQDLIDEGKSYKWAENIKIRIGQGRKKFIAGCKTERARKLIEELEGKRLAIFCGSVEQSEELGESLSLNSSRGRKHNSATLEAFNNKEIDKIYFNKMGREGLNLSSIEGIIIIQLDSGNDEGLSLIQKSGRGFRSDTPEIWILYCKGSQDEIFMKRGIKHIDKQYLTYE